MLYFARKLRSLLYNPVGMVLDAMLIATGIGKAVQWVPWAIIVALDIYEVITGNYEDKEMPTWMRWLMIGTDVLGLVFAGGVAGSAKAALSVFRGAKTAEEFAVIAAKNPKTVSWIQKIIGAFEKVPQLLGKAVTYLKSTKFVKAVPFIEKSLGSAERILANGTKSLSEITQAAKKGGAAVSKTTSNVAKQGVVQTAKTGSKAGLKTAGVVAGLDKAFKKGHQLYLGKTDAEMEAAEMMGKMVQDYEKAYGKSIGDSMDAAFSS
jgi:hypothetical protein